VKSKRHGEAFMPLLKLSVETLSGFGSFTRVITQGKKFERKPIKAFVFSSVSEQPGLHVGFAVTREIRKATQRNLLKRLMREIFRVRMKEFFVTTGSGILIEIVFLYNGNAKIPPKKIIFTSINNAMADLSSAVSSVFSKTTI
jgi:ribonuclease P protein component